MATSRSNYLQVQRSSQTYQPDIVNIGNALSNFFMAPVAYKESVTRQKAQEQELRQAELKTSLLQSQAMEADRKVKEARRLNTERGSLQRQISFIKSLPTPQEQFMATTRLKERYIALEPFPGEDQAQFMTRKARGDFMFANDPETMQALDALESRYSMLPFVKRDLKTGQDIQTGLTWGEALRVGKLDTPEGQEIRNAWTGTMDKAGIQRVASFFGGEVTRNPEQNYSILVGKDLIEHEIKKKQIDEYATQNNMDPFLARNLLTATERGIMPKSVVSDPMFVGLPNNVKDSVQMNLQDLNFGSQQRLWSQAKEVLSKATQDNLTPEAVSSQIGQVRANIKHIQDVGGSQDLFPLLDRIPNASLEDKTQIASVLAQTGDPTKQNSLVKILQDEKVFKNISSIPDGWEKLAQAAGGAPVISPLNNKSSQSPARGQAARAMGNNAYNETSLYDRMLADGLIADKQLLNQTQIAALSNEVTRSYRNRRQLLQQAEVPPALIAIEDFNYQQGVDHLENPDKAPMKFSDYLSQKIPISPFQKQVLSVMEEQHQLTTQINDLKTEEAVKAASLDKNMPYFAQLKRAQTEIENSPLGKKMIFRGGSWIPNPREEHTALEIDQMQRMGEAYTKVYEGLSQYKSARQGLGPIATGLSIKKFFTQGTSPSLALFQEKAKGTLKELATEFKDVLPSLPETKATVSVDELKSIRNDAELRYIFLKAQTDQLKKQNPGQFKELNDKFKYYTGKITREDVAKYKTPYQVRGNPLIAAIAQRAQAALGAGQETGIPQTNIPEGALAPQPTAQSPQVKTTMESKGFVLRRDTQTGQQVWVNPERGQVVNVGQESSVLR